MLTSSGGFKERCVKMSCYTTVKEGVRSCWYVIRDFVIWILRIEAVSPVCVLLSMGCLLALTLRTMRLAGAGKTQTQNRSEMVWSYFGY